MLEHEAQTFGLRERELPPWGIGSEQHMQIAVFKLINNIVPILFHFKRNLSTFLFFILH
jgi:hypothetical protein